MAVNINGTGSITGLSSISSPTISGGSLPAGTASAPGITFSGDSNTGIYSPGADKVAITTSGTERLLVDDGGRLLVGTSSARDNFFNGAYSAAFQIEGTNGPTGNDRRLSVTSSSTDANGGQIVLAKQKSGSLGDNTPVIANDQFGFLSFQGSDGTEFVEGARISAEVDGTPGANDMPGRLVFSTTADGSASPTERMRIDSNGDIGIGRTPTVELDVYRASGITRVICESASLANLQYSSVTAKGGVGSAVLGVYKHSGITNPTGYMSLRTQDQAQPYFWVDDSDQFRISTSNSHIGTTSGTVVGTQTSDERIKNILGPVEYGLDTLKQIEPVRYALKSEPSTEKLGFIAQQVRPLVPQSVFDTGEHIEGEPEDAPTKLGMEYVALIPVLVNAIKELSAEVDALKAQLQAS